MVPGFCIQARLCKLAHGRMILATRANCIYAAYALSSSNSGREPLLQRERFPAHALSQTDWSCRLSNLVCLNLVGSGIEEYVAPSFSRSLYPSDLPPAYKTWDLMRACWQTECKAGGPDTQPPRPPNNKYSTQNI